MAKPPPAYDYAPETPSGIVNFQDPRANMYGCQDCPKCGSKYRAPYKKSMTIECDDCGFSEPATFTDES